MASKKSSLKPEVESSLFTQRNTVNISKELGNIYKNYKEDTSSEGKIITGLCDTVFALLEVIERSLDELEAC